MLPFRYYALYGGVWVDAPYGSLVRLLTGAGVGALRIPVYPAIRAAGFDLSERLSLFTGLMLI